METFGIWSLIPPIIAIALALTTKNVFISLFTAIFTGSLIVAHGNVFTAVPQMFDTMVGVFTTANNVKSIFAILIVGGMIKIIETMGGVDGLILALMKRKALVRSKKAALVLTWVIGACVFTTGAMSILVSGTVSSPICKAMKIAPEKNAQVVHAVSSPVVTLIPFSAMGAFQVGYLGNMAVEVGGSPNIYYESLPFFFTQLIFVFGTLLVILTGLDFPLMKQKMAEYEKRMTVEQEQMEQAGELKGKASYLIVPMVLLVALTLILMVVSGKGNFLAGDGMSSFLFAALIALLYTIVIALKDKLMNLDQAVGAFMKGCGEMIPIATILTFAYTFSATTTTLGTGTFLGNAVGSFLPRALVPAIIYLISAVISMSTGSLAAAANTIAPIAIPMAVIMGVNMPLAVGAVYSGAVLGDCASPISDNTILTCSTTKCDVMSHVRTQLPYAMTNAAISIVLFLILGFAM